MSVEIALVVLIGLPGSGKTTLSKMLCDFLESADNFNLIIPICYDSVIPVSSITFEDGCGKSWKEDRKNVLKNVSLLIRHLRGVDGICMTSMFDSTLSVLRSTPSSERRRIFILIDDNMFYRSMRYEYYQVARLYSTGFCQLYVRCDVKDALKRNSSRELAASVPEDVILRMVEKLEPPSDCNFWEKSSLIINSERWTHEKIAEICEFVINVTRSPELAQKDCAEMREESRAHCSANVMHQVDIALRRLVGERMKEGKQKNLTPKDLQIRPRLLLI